MKRDHDQSTPCAVIGGRHLRQGVGIQHQRVAWLKRERSLELLFCENGIGRTELFYHRCIQTHTFLQLGSNNQPLALQLCHFGLHVPLAVDGQGVSRDIAGIAAQHLVNYIPECRFAVASITISNNHRLGVYLSNQAKSADHLDIVNETLVAAEEHLQGFLP